MQPDGKTDHPADDSSGKTDHPADDSPTPEGGEPANNGGIFQDSPPRADENPTPDGGEAGETSKTGDFAEDAETFPRAYVEKLRKESAKYREQARNADTHAHRLHTELVRATGKLADPSDLPFDESHLDDPDALAAAVTDLLARKPHLAARRPMGDIGQGATPSATGVDLAGMLRQRAM